MSSNRFQSIGEAIQEKADCIYERLRTQINRIGSASGPNSHIFFVLGASVCFLGYFFNRTYIYCFSRVIWLKRKYIQHFGMSKIFHMLE